MQLDFDLIVGNKAFDFIHAGRSYHYAPPGGGNSWDRGAVSFTSDGGAKVTLKLDKDIVDRKMLGLGGREVVKADVSVDGVLVDSIVNSDDAADAKLRTLLADAFIAINVQRRAFLERL
jgi:hypothetical protein